MAKKEPKPEKQKQEKQKPAKEPKQKKDKKAAAKKGKGAPAAAATNVQLTPEQEVQMQLEQAIKESNDPASRLKKIKSPINVGGCLLSLLLLIVVTIGLVYLILYFQVDKFDFMTITKDMFDKLGITGFFQAIGNWFKNLFAGKGNSGGDAPAEIIKMLLMMR